MQHPERNTWSGSIVACPARLGGGSVSVDIQTASIDTNHGDA